MDFIYNGKTLSEFGFSMYDPDEKQSFSARELDRAEISPFRSVPNHYSAHYSDTLSLNFLIMRDQDFCQSPHDYEIFGEELSIIRSWLESPKEPMELTVITDDDIKPLNYFGVFTEIQPWIHREMCCGLYLKFKCNSEYAFSDIYKKIYSMNSNYVSGYFINRSTERNEYLKPKIVIRSGSSFRNEVLTITNNTDDRKEMKITLPSGKEEIIIDCEKKIITDENGNLLTMSEIGLTLPTIDNYDLMSAINVQFYWLSLLPGRNNLEFTVSGNYSISEIEINTRFKIRSGGF